MFIQATQIGLEPTTSAVTGRRSNQLSHWAIPEECLNTYLQNHIQNVFLHPFNPALLSLLRKRIPRNLWFLGTFAPQSFRPSPHDSERSVPLHGPDGLPVFSALWISLRPISNSQLHASRHFHLCPIYLVVFKGSWDISS